jgi:dienelactone hydrolase
MSELAQGWGGKALVHEWYPVDGALTAILLCPTVMGVTDLERGFAAELNAKGHSVLIADLYGARFTADNRVEARAAMDALRGDRAGLRDLLVAVLETFRPLAGDLVPIVAIGFCFGGGCVLDLARSGADIAGVASFHGLFDPPGLEPRPIKARVIAFHGWDDPLATPDSVVALGAELSAAACDWQIHGYGGVGHAFTNPGATGTMPGVKYDSVAARRSWAGLDHFLGEIA